MGLVVRVGVLTSFFGECLWRLWDGMGMARVYRVGCCRSEKRFYELIPWRNLSLLRVFCALCDFGPFGAGHDFESRAKLFLLRP